MTFFLFNDTLAYAHKIGWKFKLNRKIPIDGSFSIEDVPDLNHTGKHIFRINSAQKSFVVYCANAQSKKNWMQDITEISEKRKAAVRGFGESKAAPVWQQDDATTDCPTCNKTFSLLIRRHHCRSCGVLCCADCSKHRAVVPGPDPDPQRVCDKCFQTLSRGATPKQLDTEQVAPMTRRGTYVQSPSSVTVNTTVSPRPAPQPVSAVSPRAAPSVPLSNSRTMPSVGVASSTSSALSPRGPAVAPRGPAVAPRGPAVAPRGPAAAPSASAVSPRGPASPGRVASIVNTASSASAVAQPKPVVRQNSLPAAQAIPANAKKVIQSYQPVTDSELALVQGTYITLLDTDNDEWWYGRDSSGREGYFPKTFVQ